MESKGARCSKFNPDILKEKDTNGDTIGIWCIPGSKPWEAICCICNITVNCSQRGSSAAIKRHASSAKHVERCRKNRKDDGTLKKPLQQRFTLNTPGSVTVLSHADKVLSAEIRFAFSTVSGNVPYSYGDIATYLFKNMFPDSSIARDFTCCRKKLSYIISDGIGLYIKENLLNEIVKHNSYYSVQIDETPIPEKRVKQLDVNIRFYSEEQKEVVSHHLESHHIGCATADILHEKLRVSLAFLPAEKLINLFSDGPNIMKSLKQKMEENYPNLIDIGTCNLHIVHNAFSKALESFGAEVETLLIDLYYFFKHSAVQSEHLMDIQVRLGFPEHVLLRHVSSRWLSLYSSVNRFIEQFGTLSEFFTLKNATKNETSRFKKICESFSQKSLLATAFFLRNVSEIFNDIQKLFQREEPLVHIMYDELERLIKKIMGRFIKCECFSNVTGVNLMNVELDKGENWLKKAEVGLDTENELKNLSYGDRKSFYLGARSFYISCTRYLLTKLPIANKFLKNLKCLHPLYIMEPSSLQCIKMLASSVPFIIPANKVSELLDEWVSLQTEDLNKIITSEEWINDHPECIDHFWRKIFSIKNNSGTVKYNILSHVVKALIILAHGNADCERGFSTNKRLLEGRSSLNIYSLNGMRQMKSHLKRFNNNVENLEITRELLKAVRNSRQVYQARLDAEKKSVDNNEKRKLVNHKETELEILLAEGKNLQNQLNSAQNMLVLAEKHISNGLKMKDLKEIEGAQVLLREAKEKIPSLTEKIKKNKEDQLQYSCKKKKKLQ